MAQPIHIMIAEDEQSIRMGIKKMVEDFFDAKKEFDYIIMEAKDGRDAFRKCVSNGPDILITDIKMPGISGISLIKRLAQDKICQNILVISGFPDYKYVREAMKSGIYDYLLKPIKKAQLWEALDHFVENLTPSPSEKLGTIYMEQRVIERLFMEEPDEQDVYANFLKEQNLSEDMACQVFFFDNDQSGGFELYYEVRQFCETVSGVCPIQGEHNSWIVLCVFREPAKAGFAEALKNHLSLAGYPVLSHFSLNSLAEVYELNAKLRDAFYNKIDINTNTEERAEPPTAETLIEQIIRLVLQGTDTEHLNEAIEKLFDRYQLDRTPQEQIRNDIMGLLYHLMAHNADMIELVMNARFSSHDVSENLLNATTLLSMRDVVNEGLAYLNTQIRERRLASEDITINKAVRFMEEHFASNIQLANVAEAVFLHPNYFSALFRKKMGLTFRDYLRELRIGHAKQLIQTQNFSVNEIAEQSGFKDTTHFFRVFKTVTGVTPKKYRQIVLGGSPEPSQL